MIDWKQNAIEKINDTQELAASAYRHARYYYRRGQYGLAKFYQQTAARDFVVIDNHRQLLRDLTK